MNKETQRLQKVYAQKYKIDWDNSNCPGHPLTPLSFYYHQAREHHLTKLFKRHKLKLSQIKILDMGCGYGHVLRWLIQVGALPENCSGIDLIDYRIKKAKLLNPNIDYLIEGAESLSSADKSFDLVCCFTLFSSILDKAMQEKIVREINRILKPGGYILWYDMFRKYPRNADLAGINKKYLKKLFSNFQFIDLKKVHFRYAHRLVKRILLFNLFLEYLPIKSHYLGLFKKND